MIRLDRASVLVTGAGGFLGSAVVRAIAGRAARVRALLGPPGAAVAGAPPGVEPAWAEIDDARALHALAAGVDVVVHLAGPPSVAASFDDPVDYVRVHAGGTAAVLAACLRAGVGRVVYVSSAEVYGAPPGRGERPVGEDEPLAARSPYGAAKIAAEELVRGYYRALGGEAVVLRPFSLYGPGSPPWSLLGLVLRQARSAEAVELADLRPERDYCFVADAAAAVVAACTAPPGVYNVGTGRGTKAAALAALVLRAVGRTAPIREVPARRRPAAVEILRLVADTARARTELGWSASTSIEAGIEATVRATAPGMRPPSPPAG
jgi:nucleoside-diphosphate-sugar epimerase